MRWPVAAAAFHHPACTFPLNHRRRELQRVTRQLRQCQCSCCGGCITGRRGGGGGGAGMGRHGQQLRQALSDDVQVNGRRRRACAQLLPACRSEGQQVQPMVEHVVVVNLMVEHVVVVNLMVEHVVVVKFVAGRGRGGGGEGGVGGWGGASDAHDVRCDDEVWID